MEGRLSKFYGTEERFQVILVMFSYGSSFLMTLITLIAEFTSPKCATYRPKFGGKGGSCFFNGTINILSKMVIGYLFKMCQLIIKSN